MTGPLILVTGGAGFIGSNIVAELAADPARPVAVCDRLRDSATGKWRNLAKHPIADLLAPEQMFDWLEAHRDELGAIVHMGAISSTTETDVDRIVEVNFRLSRDLWRWCAANGTRLVYASSAATYGDGSQGFDDRADPAFLAGLRPLNPYGWSKALFDGFCAREATRGSAPPSWAGLKFFNVFGPNEGHKGPMRSVVAKIWPDVAAGRPVRLFASDNPDYADGGQMRDFVYVRDVAACVAWMTGADLPSGLYNVGSGCARSFADLASATFAAAGREPRIDYVDMPPELQGRYQYFTQAPMDRLKAAGWNGPARSLEAAVADYVQGFLATDDPYR